MFDIGIDIGGTKIAAGILDERGQIICKGSISSGLTSKQTVAGIRELLGELMLETGVDYSNVNCIGIGSPGEVDRKSLIVSNASNMCFDSVDFSDVFPIPASRVFLENDANAAAWGEAIAGVSSESGFSVMVTIGTGIGGGIVLNKKIYTGYNGKAGEIGHIVIRKDGRFCACGRRGCWEAYASANALIGQVKKEMRKNRESVLWDIVRGDTSLVDGKTVFLAARKKDRTALEVLDRYSGFLACGLSSVIVALQPEVICIGGGISAEGDYLLSLVRKKIHVEIGKIDTKILPASLANDAGIIGAALLYRQLNA